jgi:hypothetical protein
VRLKAEVDSSSREVRKILFVEKKRERLHGGMQWDPENQWSPGSSWVLKPFFVLPEGGDVSQVQTDVSWEEVSPWLFITFWDLLQSALQVPPSQ